MFKRKAFKNNNKTEAKIASLAATVERLEDLAAEVRVKMSQINPDDVNAIRRKNKQRSVLGMDLRLYIQRKELLKGSLGEIPAPGMWWKLLTTTLDIRKNIIRFANSALGGQSSLKKIPS